MESSTDTDLPDDLNHDLRIAEILEQWQSHTAAGETPDLLQLAGGDAALAEQVRRFADVLRTIEASGFEQVSPAPIETALQSEDMPEVPDFVVNNELGRGGMGIVYEARQVSLDRIVALKLLPLGTVDRAAAHRFAQEAATAASLQHPNIVPIYATGQATGTHWYAMQRIDGQPLSRVIADHPSGIAWQRVVEIGIIAAEALAYAHRQGVVHRDVKPANLLQDGAGHIWLTDFGLARRDIDAAATLSQAMLGTPRYMSPEQIGGSNKAVDHRTDIYGLGATLYELATGRSVVSGDSPLDVLEKIRHEEPTAPRAINRRIPRALEVVLLKCLEKAPRDRYATAADLLSDLQALRDGRPIAARGLPPWTVWGRRCSRHASRIRLAAIAATLSIAVVGTGILCYQQYAASRRAALQMSSAGGPFVATIRRAAADSSHSVSTSEVASVTLPMQQPLELQSGEYDIDIASEGRFSEHARLHLAPGDMATPRYVDRRPQPPAIDVDRLWFSEIHSASEPAATFLAALDDRSLVVYGDEGRERFRLDLSGAAVAGTTSDMQPSVEEVTTAAELFQQVDFSYQFGHGLTGSRGARRPYLARPQRFMPSAPDLNDDGQLDLVVAARLLPVVAALDHRGEMLWASRMDVQLPPDAPPPAIGYERKPVEFPSILQMLLTKDHTGDGTADVLVASAAFRPPQAVYPQLTLLSGRDGSQVWTTSLPTITASVGANWPLAGLLKSYSQSGDEYRSMRSLLVQQNGEVIRNLLVVGRTIQWTAGIPYSAVLPATPRFELFGEEAEQAIVVTAADEMRRLEVATGRLLDPITLAKTGAMLASPPRAVKLGQKRPPGFLVHSCATAMGPPVDDQLTVFASDGVASNGRRPLWSKSLALRWDLVSQGREQSDFPLLADLDHDGADEILVAIAVPSFDGKGKRIECLDAKTGESRWKTPVRMHCVESAPERICVIGDVDGDGVDDLAIASLFGEARDARKESIRNWRARVSVYIDVVSGRTGQRLKVLQQLTAETDKFTRMMEIDALRPVTPGVVEASVVWGESRERLVDSLTLRFSLNHEQLPLAAPGLTALTRLSPAGSGYYLRRPGPDETGSESAVWIEPVGDRLLLGGYRWSLASWTSAQGEPRVLLQDRAMSRLAVLDVPTGRLLWRQATGVEQSLARALRLDNQDWLLVQSFDGSSACRLSCFDAETGQVRATLSNQSLGVIYDAAPCEAKSGRAFALCGAPGAFPMSASLAGFYVRKIDVRTAETVWQRRILNSLSPQMMFQHQLKLLTADVNGDGMADCIVPDGVAGDADAVRLVALSGRDGSELWSRATGLTISGWPRRRRWPKMEIADSQDGRQHLILIDSEGTDRIVVRLVKVSTGKELDSRAYATRDQHLNYFASQRGKLSLQVHRRSGSDPIVSLVVPELDASRRLALECSQFSIQGDELRQAASTKLQAGEQDPQAYLVAGDASGNLVRIVLTGDLLTGCQSRDDTVLWRQTLAPAGGPHVLTMTSAPGYVFCQSGDSCALLNVMSGQAVWSDARVELNDLPEGAMRDPELLMRGEAPCVIRPQREGVQFISLQAAATGAKSPAGASVKATMSVFAGRDPRRWRRPVASPLYGGTALSTFIASLARRAVESLLAFVIPIAGVYWFVRHRRFSMAQLLLAPPAALVCLMTWRILLAPAGIGEAAREPWPIVLISGTMVVIAAAFVVRSVVERRQWPLVAAFTLAAGFTAAMQWIPALQQGDDIRYRLSWDHFLAEMILILVSTLPGGYVIWSFVRFIGRRIQRRAAHGG